MVTKFDMDKIEVARLEQQNLGRGKQSFILHEDGTLFITVKKWRFQHSAVSLAGWSPDPTHEKSMPRLLDTVIFCAVSVLLLALFAGLLFASFVTPTVAISGLMLYFGLLMVWWLVLLDRFLHRKDHFLIFRNPETGAWFALFNDVPNVNEVSSFVETLAAIIKKVSNARPRHISATPHDFYELTRLRDDGILTHEEFEEASRKLFANTALLQEEMLKTGETP